MISARCYAQQILNNHKCISEALSLEFSGFHIQVISNNSQILADMRDYFGDFVTGDMNEYESRIYIFQSDTPTPNLEFQDWSREQGKAGRKDAFYDVDDGRFCWKVRTGMNYVLCDDYRIAYGPVLENFSQAINFTLNQHMEWLMNHGGLICHAAAVSFQGSGIALSAFSGGGKSTTALFLMNQGMDFVSNDRLFLRKEGDSIRMYGIAKQPRINPGTILNNDTLKSILPKSRVDELSKMAEQDLWNLEEKYDAMIDDLYGKNRYKLDSEIHAHVILNWTHDSHDETKLESIDIHQRGDLLEAVIKSPGPFYMDTNGKGWPNENSIDKKPYLDVLSSIDVYEVSGKVDFDKIIQPLENLVKTYHDRTNF